jgi:hypothetical protein
MNIKQKQVIVHTNLRCMRVENEYMNTIKYSDIRMLLWIDKNKSERPEV